MRFQSSESLRCPVVWIVIVLIRLEDLNGIWSFIVTYKLKIPLFKLEKNLICLVRLDPISCCYNHVLLVFFYGRIILWG